MSNQRTYDFLEGVIGPFFLLTFVLRCVSCLYSYQTVVLSYSMTVYCTIIWE